VVTYQISFPEPGSHLVAVRLEFRAPTPAASEDPACTVWMAAWTPGSYLVREYARNVRALRAEVDGQPAALTKLRKDSWHIAARPGQLVAIDYTVHAHELSVRTAHHDASHAFLHPAQIFLIPAHLRGPFTVELALPADWDAVSLCADPAHERRAPGRFTLELPDLDTLLDTPIEAGRLHVRQLPAPCAHVRLAVWGEPLPDLVCQRLAPVVAQVEATWPSRPYDHYTFIVHAAVGAVGGLEHLFGSVLGVDPERFAPALRHARAGSTPTADADDGLLDFLELAAHELFHAWNGKRLRPAILGPFDYHRENYTRELWLLEGLTSYYDRLCVLRSGQMPVATFLQAASATTSPASPTSPAATSSRSPTPASTPGSSSTAPRTTAPTLSVSYYLKGSLVGLLIDLWLRSDPARERRPRRRARRPLERRRGPQRRLGHGRKNLLFPGFSSKISSKRSPPPPGPTAAWLRAHLAATRRARPGTSSPASAST
jgi:predicted metalloprotease with PDZ domain